MKIARATLRSVMGSDLMYGKAILDKKKTSETHEQFEERTWKQKVHCDDKGLFIPEMALKLALETTGAWLSMPIVGEGKKTYTQRFLRGITVTQRLYLTTHEGVPLKMEGVDPIPLLVNSQGKHNQPGPRVVRIFPTVHEWMTEAEILVIDDKISEPVLRKHLEACGQFTGFGAMRVQNGGLNGRFEVVEFFYGDV